METESRITINNDGTLSVPDTPRIPFIEGDGIGPEIWHATRQVIDAAVHKAYEGRKKISWLEVLAGEKGFEKTGNWLPDETLADIEKHAVAIKGPMTTPVGKGIRSLNVTIRQTARSLCLRAAGAIYQIGSQPRERPRKR